MEKHASRSLMNVSCHSLFEIKNTFSDTEWKSHCRKNISQTGLSLKYAQIELLSLKHPHSSGFPLPSSSGRQQGFARGNPQKQRTWLHPFVAALEKLQKPTCD